MLEQTLDKLSTYPQSGYNDYCKQLCTYRLSVMNKYHTHNEIENILRAGQIEEILIQIEKEYELCVAMNTRDEFIQLQTLDNDTINEWKSYSDPIGANATLTLLTPEMIKNELENSDCWAEIDAELDAEGIPPAPKITVDQKILDQYAKNIAI